MNKYSCKYFPYTLFFYRPAGTSRGILYEKLSYFIVLKDDLGNKYYAECGLLKGLSIDDVPGYEKKLKEVCLALEKWEHETIDLTNWPSILCGVEMLELAIKNKSNNDIFPSSFTTGLSHISINGLIWMGDQDFMMQQMRDKIEKDFGCIKMKVGAIDWSIEKKLLQELRNLGGQDLVIRVDANGAWKWNEEIKQKMEFLYSIGVHSIEQPIEVNKHDEMAALSAWSPVDIALDEELFHFKTKVERATLLDDLKVKYVVLKPSLVGGFRACDEWIELCKERNMGYWITSALESNVALNAISQYAFLHAGNNYQGLGTGSLYENNIESPLIIERDQMRFDKTKSWDYSFLK